MQNNVYREKNRQSQTLLDYLGKMAFFKKPTRIHMSKFFDDEMQPVVTKLTIRCPKCGTKNDVWFGFSIVGKDESDSQPKQRTYV